MFFRGRIIVIVCNTFFAIFYFFSSVMNSFSPFFLGLHVHMLFVGVTLVGGVLFLAWALKMKPAEMKKWVIWLLVIGILGALITSSFSGAGLWMRGLGGGSMMGNWEYMMNGFNAEGNQNGDLVPGMMKNR